ncbi:hypothetical protein GGR58DRAFT_118636 [Xylaria digitata]|nr:hypothetical protein GGR58DRAFT_118636 [Xylaria digitata]
MHLAQSHTFYQPWIFFIGPYIASNTMDVVHNMSLEPEVAVSSRADGSVDHLRPAEPELQIDPALEKRVVRKIDLHLIPLVTSLYLVAFLDRSNIGNAQLAGMVAISLSQL